MFKDLKSQEKQNTLSNNAKEQIWMPSLTFTNTKEHFIAKFQDDDSVARILVNPSK